MSAESVQEREATIAAAEAAVEQARADLEARTSALQQELSDTTDWRRWVRKHPALTTIGAVGAGLILVGALRRPGPRGLIGSGLKFGLQLAAMPLLKTGLAALSVRLDKSGFGSTTRSKRGRP
jgi:hypothetical protein